MLTRREFLSTATVTLLLVPIACSSNNGSYGTGSSTNPTEPCDGAGATSSVTQGHTHMICVPASDLSSPPAAGAQYTTTSANGHTHTVSLTQDQLTSIARGETVNVTTSSTNGHTHAFSVARTGGGQSSPPPNRGGGSTY